MHKKFVLSSIIILCLFGGVLCFFLYKCLPIEGDQKANQLHLNETNASLSNTSTQDYSQLDLVFGALDAPIKIIQYTSLNCGHCAHFHSEVFPVLKKKYIDTGQVVMLIKHFPLDSQALDAASLLAGLPKFRQIKLMDELFARQSEWMGRDHIEKLSTICNLSQEDCLKMAENKQISEAILNEQLTAQKKFKVTATPTFVINGRIIPYAPSLEEIEALIGESPSPHFKNP